jgi:hypothetical protein
VVASVGTAVATGDSAAVDATASPSGVAVTAAVGTAIGTGDALAAPVGVAMVAAVGTAVASGDALDGTAFPAGVAMVAAVGDVEATGDEDVISRGGLLYQSRWPAVAKHAKAKPKGVEARTAIGRAVATGDAVAYPPGVSMTARVGHPTATGVQNLPEDVLAVLLLLELDEAA